MRLFLGIVVLLLLACAMPSTTVRTPDNRPSLAIAGAPPGSQLFVDGNAMGKAAAYDGHPRVLVVEPGTHLVDVRDTAGRVLFEQTVFVESETKTVQVH
jgi:hypothetical protein